MSRTVLGRRLMFVGAGIETLPGIERAQSMGCRVVVSDANPSAPGVTLADDFLHADTYNIEATVDAATLFHQQHPIHGVLAMATDVPRTVAAVAQALELPGITPHAALLAADKLLMKQAFRAAEIPIPWFSSVQNVAELLQYIKERGLPLVIKPVDSRGARGVLKLTEALDPAWAFAFAQSQSPTGRVMLEQYLSGPQVSTESILLNGVAHTPGFSDRNYEYLERFAPHIIENGGELPSHLDIEMQENVRNLVTRAALAMGIENGVVKGDIVIHEQQPHIIEMAARLSGGFFCSHEIPLNTGVDFVGLAIRQALGETIAARDLQVQFQKPVVQRYLFTPPGHVTDVRVEAWVEQDPDIALFQLRIKPGDTVGPVHSHPARGGVVIATGVSKQAAIEKAEAAVNAISVQIQTQTLEKKSIETLPVETQG